MNSFSVNKRGTGMVGLFLLIAAVMIALVAGVAYLDNIQPNLRDSKRLKHLNYITKGLEKYETFFGNYPISNPTAQIITPDSSLSELFLDTSSSVKRLPQDPRHPEYSYKYKTDPSGRNYTITFCMESERELYQIGCENFITSPK